MKRVWIGIALLASLSLLWVDYYHQPADAWVWIIVAAIGVTMLTGTLQRLPGRPVAAVGALLILPAAWVAPWPYSLGPILIAVGLVIGPLPVPEPWNKRIGATSLFAGVVLLAQGLAMVGYQAFTARFAQLPVILSRMLEGIARLMGMNAAFNGRTLTVFGMRENQPFAPTWSLLLDPVTLCFTIGAVVLILLQLWSSPTKGSTWQRWLGPVLKLLGGIALWLPVRAGLMMALTMHRLLRTDYNDPINLMNQFWSPWVHLVLIAVPFMLAWRFVPRKPREQVSHFTMSWKPTPSGWFAVIAAFVGVAALTAAATWVPVGTRKAGRVLVDEYHSNAPWPGKTFDTVRTNKPFDKEWYGHESAYNLACLYDYCSRFYQMSRTETFDPKLPIKDVLTDLALADIDVLVLKDPSLAYSPLEIAAVHNFVERGGGLLLIGEHTSVFGSGVNLNQIAREYGFQFRYDCLFGIDAFFEQHYEPPLIPHPIIQNLPPMDFAISCSIDPSAGSGRAVIQATGLKSLGADYHATNFYPQTQNRAQMLYGAFVQVWATRAGKGRVVAFTDSTIFANFAAFEPGKSELMLGMLEWLNHRGGWNCIKPVMVLLGMILLITSVFFGRKWDMAWVAMLAAGLLGWAVSVQVVQAVHRNAMPVPKSGPMVRVAMDRTISAAALPKNGFIGGKAGQFGQFERSILRLGYFPFRAEGEKVTQADVVVIIYPSLTVQPAYRDLLVNYVYAGGKLLVLDSPDNTQSTANNLLYPFGLSTEHASGLSGDLTGPEGFPTIPIKSSRIVKGDNATVLAQIAGYPVAATAYHGQGSVTVIGFGSRFDEPNMGVIGDVVPDENLHKVFDFEFALLEAIVNSTLPRPAAVSTPTN